MHEALRNGHIGLSKYLIHEGADVNMKAKVGRLLLMFSTSPSIKYIFHSRLHMSSNFARLVIHENLVFANKLFNVNNYIIASS